MIYNMLRIYLELGKTVGFESLFESNNSNKKYKYNS